MHIYHLVFLSRATSPASDALFESIRNCAERNNTANQITGLLLHCAGYYMEVLEGAARDVADTYARVNNDARHTDIECLYFERSPHRFYPDWSLGVYELMRTGVPVSRNELRRILEPADGVTHYNQMSYGRVVRAFEKFRSLVTGSSFNEANLPSLDDFCPADLAA